ncbi:MAG: hypothetical protein ACRCXM_06655 [Beijerinckiaceae bacterium]
MTTTALRFGLAALLALSIAACSTTPQPQADLTPPPVSKRDAKAELESGIRPR